MKLSTDVIAESTDLTIFDLQHLFFHPGGNTLHTVCIIGMVMALNQRAALFAPIVPTLKLLTKAMKILAFTS